MSSWQVWLLHRLRGPGKPIKSGNQVTMLQFASYRVARRPQFSLLHSSGKLTQLRFVDVRCRVEASHLQYVREKQAALHADTRVGLADALHTTAERERLRTGIVVFLPSTYWESKVYSIILPRHYDYSTEIS